MSQRPPLYEAQRARLEAYAKAKASLDLEHLSEYTTEAGWHIDDYAQELPAENPGPPRPLGSFESAQRVLRNYSFPPPSLITGIYLPDTPLEERVMVLRGRFLFFTFWFGVRVGRVTDEVQTMPDGHRVQVWGYNYHTLEGHFEQGQIEFLIHKDLDTGRVWMTIHAISKTGHIQNIFYRIGFRIFGRGLQRRFAHESLRRTRQQVEQMLQEGRSSVPAGTKTPVQAVDTEQLPDDVAAKVEEHVEQRQDSGQAAE